MRDETDQQQAGIPSYDDVTPTPAPASRPLPRPTGEGERDEAQVEFADPANRKLPLDTARHIHAAWNYITHDKTASEYEPDEVEQIKARILRAAEQHKIQISVDSHPPAGLEPTGG